MSSAERRNGSVPVQATGRGVRETVLRKVLPGEAVLNALLLPEAMARLDRADGQGNGSRRAAP